MKHILVALLLATTVQAQRLKRPIVKLYVLDGKFSIYDAHIRNVIIPEVLYRFRYNVGLNMRIRKVIHRPAPTDDWFVYYDPKRFRSNQNRRLDYCGNNSATWRKRRRNRVAMCILPPMLSKTSCDRWVAGMAYTSQYGLTKNYAIAQCENANAKGVDRRYACAVVVAHELGHVFSASHITGTPNLMDGGAGAYWDKYKFALRFLEKTKEQIWAYIKRLIQLRRRNRK